LGFIIRPARIEDATGIFDTHRRSIQEVCAKDYTAQQIQTWFPSTRTPARYADFITNNEEVFIVELEKRIIGYLHIQKDVLTACYILPEFINKGIGTALFQTAEGIFKKRNIKKITLTSSITALTFYQKMGMKVIKPALHQLNSDISLEVYIMEKNLA